MPPTIANALSPEALGARLNAARGIAVQAGAILLAGWGTRPAVRTKSSVLDLVTEFDKRSEALVVSELRAAFPGDGIVGEEGARVEGEPGSPTWYVDPLDGTTNFAHGVPLFAVSLGLAAGTEPVGGVIHAPALGWTFAGGPSLGANRDGVAISVSVVDRLEDAVLATGFPYARGAAESNIPEWTALTGRVHGTRRLGSAALDLAFVACGWFDGFWERHIQPWDLVGGAALVRAAGGRVSDLDGATFDGRTGRAVATNGRIHEALRAELETVARAQGAPWP